MSHAASGRVRVAFQRWNGRRAHWSKPVVRIERVHRGGTFRVGAHVAAHPGLWRVRAHFLGTRGVRRSASSFRHFRTA